RQAPPRPAGEAAAEDRSAAPTGARRPRRRQADQGGDRRGRDHEAEATRSRHHAVRDQDPVQEPLTVHADLLAVPICGAGVALSITSEVMAGPAPGAYTPRVHRAPAESARSAPAGHVGPLLRQWRAA